MATKWLGEIRCRWCDTSAARVGVEKDGEGKTYRVQCTECGVMSQVAFHYPAGKMIADELDRPIMTLEELNRRLQGT